MAELNLHQSTLSNNSHYSPITFTFTGLSVLVKVARIHVLTTLTRILLGQLHVFYYTSLLSVDDLNLLLGNLYNCILHFCPIWVLHIFPAGLRNPQAMRYQGVWSLLAARPRLLITLLSMVEKSKSSKNMSIFSLAVKWVNCSLKINDSSQLGWRLWLWNQDIKKVIITRTLTTHYLLKQCPHIIYMYIIMYLCWLQMNGWVNTGIM